MELREALAMRVARNEEAVDGSIALLSNMAFTSYLKGPIRLVLSIGCLLLSFLAGLLELNLRGGFLVEFFVFILKLISPVGAKHIFKYLNHCSSMIEHPHRIYLAGPLFSEAELQFNKFLTECLRSAGHMVFLPQESCPLFDELLASGMSEKQTLRHIFEKDMAGLENCDLLLIVLDGRVPDEGACFELGWAYAKGMNMIGLKTDPRSAMYGYDNAMIATPLMGKIANNLPELLVLIDSL